MGLAGCPPPPLEFPSSVSRLCVLSRQAYGLQLSLRIVFGIVHPCLHRTTALCLVPSSSAVVIQSFTQSTASLHFNVSKSSQSTFLDCCRIMPKANFPMWTWISLLPSWISSSFFSSAVRPFWRGHCFTQSVSSLHFNTRPHRLNLPFWLLKIGINQNPVSV